jgi:hypothetical protein
MMQSHSGIVNQSDLVIDVSGGKVKQTGWQRPGGRWLIVAVVVESTLLNPIFDQSDVAV